MALKANALRPPFFSPQTPSLPSLTRYHRHHRNIPLRCQSSLVDEQQKEVVSFSEPENSLVEALIGVQGRGRSVSSHQLTVICFAYFFILCLLVFISIQIRRFELLLL